LGDAISWDLFICHASEDKEEIARPLAEALRNRGLKVWYDELTLTLGDSLSGSIDHGLAKSRFGVVILSPSFFQKRWPQRELNGLTAKEISSGKTILPVWHKVDREYVLQYSPPLADRLAVSTDKGLEHVVNEILRAISANQRRTRPLSLQLPTGPISAHAKSELPIVRVGDVVPTVTDRQNLSVTILWSKESAICVNGPYTTGYYTFTAKPRMKFIIVAYQFQNNWVREQTTPYLNKGEITIDKGYIYSVWKPPLGANSEDYAPRRATNEEIETLAGTSAAFKKLLPEDSCIGSVVFEIPAGAKPVKAVLFEVPLLLRFEK
jgi:hypothetical protein